MTKIWKKEREKGKWKIIRRQYKLTVRERWGHGDKGERRKKMMGDETMPAGLLSRCEEKVPRHTKHENEGGSIQNFSKNSPQRKY